MRYKHIFVTCSMLLLIIMQSNMSMAAEQVDDISRDSREVSSRIITLNDALRMALEKNPELVSLSLEIDSSDSLVLQAGLRPNPEIEFEVEEFGGSGELSGFDAAAFSLRLGQTIELGGKRGKRVAASSLEKEMAEWDLNAKQLDVVLETTVSFYEVLAAQEQLALAQESYDLSNETLRVVSERVEAGKVSPLERTRAEVEFSTTRIELERKERELDIARKRLAANWGDNEFTFEGITGEFSDISENIYLDELTGETGNNPDILRWDTELRLKQAELSLEKSNGTSDLTIEAGVLRFRENDETALVLSLSMDLPLFDRNQGNISAAKFSAQKSKEEMKSAEISVKTEYDATYQELLSAQQEALILRNDVLPAAIKAFESTQEGYRYGKFGLLDVLDSQRALIEVKNQYIQALYSYHTSLAKVNRLVGKRPLFMADALNNERKEK